MSGLATSHLCATDPKGVRIAAFCADRLIAGTRHSGDTGVKLARPMSGGAPMSHQAGFGA